MDKRDDKRQGEAAADEDEAKDADFRDLAEDWIAIWQSELTAYLMDPETQAHWSAMLALWGDAAQAMLRAVPPSPHGFQGLAPGFVPAHEPKPSPGPAVPDQPAGPHAAARPAPAADASESRDDEVRRLEQRVAELERRLGDASRPDASHSHGAAGGDRRPRRGGRARG